VNAERTAAVVAILAGCLAARIGAQPLATEGQAGWSLASPLATSRGIALWLDDGAGSWRLEIAVAQDGDPAVADLLERRGEGWTVACAGGSSVLLQPWGKPWRETGADFAAAAATVLARWEGSGATTHPARRPWRATSVRDGEPEGALVVEALPDDWNPAGGAGNAGGGLRRELATRGRGRGGLGLRLRLARTLDGGLALTSARWPGRLSLMRPVLSRRPDVPAEAYLPIWSLAEIGLTPGEP
jgi:hypothetical protein